MISSCLTITLNRATGFTLPITQYDGTTPVDISTSDIVLHVPGVFALPAIPNPLDPMGQLLKLTADHAEALGNRPRTYFVIITIGNEKSVLVEGTIRAEGVAI